MCFILDLRECVACFCLKGSHGALKDDFIGFFVQPSVFVQRMLAALPVFVWHPDLYVP